MAIVTANPCLFCEQQFAVRVSDTGLEKWKHGAFVQDAFPELSAGERELLVSGTCPSCWKKHMRFEEDDDGS